MVTLEDKLKKLSPEARAAVEARAKELAQEADLTKPEKASPLDATETPNT